LYCDTRTGQDVAMSWLAQGSENPSLLLVDPALSHGVLSAPAVAVTVTKQVAPTCQVTDGGQFTTVYTTTENFVMVGLWLATGPAQTTFPGETVRPAAAVVSVLGNRSDGLDHLGPPSFAQISSYTPPPSS